MRKERQEDRAPEIGVSGLEVMPSKPGREPHIASALDTAQITAYAASVQPN
jgi:hypothetical protein